MTTSIFITIAVVSAIVLLLIGILIGLKLHDTFEKWDEEAMKKRNL